ncbi:MADS-box transcription factor 31-like [Brachypodium distachyon]|uniref:MADS-box transcription factor 38 n=3 Tax=Brachypodium distachyon TaxID=15368 RepID=I1J1T0_BRADI|nr:MADS-box transcription factor 31-like [Brachypodium distachyon]AIG21846.1 MADS-box transcription factor 38 [Brachypodium distachyon]|eukprot:NP_001289806.1 MADS-box transcription factor 31-like [Brachypodium distachyon]
MGRGKVELKKIENTTSRQVTFSKRRMGLLKKANELAILCDAQIGVVIFSGSGKMYEYSSPPWRITTIFDRYLKAPSTRFDEMDIQQRIIHEMTRMKDESNRLKIIMRQYMGEDLGSLTLQDVLNLEQQIDFSLYKIRLRKQQLLDQQLLEMRHGEMHIPEDQSSYLCHMDPASGQQSQAAEMIDPKLFPLWDVGSQLYSQDAESSMTALKLSPQLQEYKLQPLQPNLQEADLHGYVLRLW